MMKELLNYLLIAETVPLAVGLIQIVFISMPFSGCLCVCVQVCVLVCFLFVCLLACVLHGLFTRLYVSHAFLLENPGLQGGTVQQTLHGCR